MPTLLLLRGYRFFFYMNEHLPIHVHITKAASEARIVLVPEICKGFKKNEIREIIEITIEHYEEFIEKWNNTFGQ
jgi:hypothetical protein